MKHVEVLERTADVVTHQPDTIDMIAEQRARELVDYLAERIRAEKAAELVKIFDKLGAQYAGRRIAQSVHFGDMISDVEVFATRTPDWTQLDEVFTRETIYDPVLKRPMSRYTVDMYNQEGKHRVVLNSDQSMTFARVIDNDMTTLTKAEADKVMSELVYRAEMAVGAYEIRKEAAAEDGVDPRVYSDAADAHAISLLRSAGYVWPQAAPLE